MISIIAHTLLSEGRRLYVQIPSKNRTYLTFEDSNSQIGIYLDHKDLDDIIEVIKKAQGEFYEYK